MLEWAIPTAPPFSRKYLQSLSGILPAVWRPRQLHPTAIGPYNAVSFRKFAGDTGPYSNASFRCFANYKRNLLAVIGAALSESSFLLWDPSVFCFRTLRYDDPVRNLKPDRIMFTQTPIQTQSIKAKIVRSAVSLLEYLLVIGATANVMNASRTLGAISIVVWRCEIPYYPFIWITLAVVPDLMGSSSWLTSDAMRTVRASESGPGGSILVKAWHS